MSDTPNIRLERIERLLAELEYEVTRGMLNGEIEEEMGLRFFVPLSKKIPDGVVFCEWRTRPVPRHCMGIQDLQPRLRVVKSERNTTPNDAAPEPGRSAGPTPKCPT